MPCSHHTFRVHDSLVSNDACLVHHGNTITLSDGFRSALKLIEIIVIYSYAICCKPHNAKNKDYIIFRITQLLK